MKQFEKYLLVVFLFENVAAQTRLLGGVSGWLFYAAIVSGVLLFFSPTLWNRDTIRSCWWAYALSAIYLIYEFFVGNDTISSQTLLYLAAKVTSFMIIVVGVASNYEFYRDKMLFPLAVWMTFFLLYGLLTGGFVGGGESRLYLGYANPNTTSHMGATIIGLVMFSGEKRRKMLRWFMIAVGLYALFGGGSRSGMLLMAFFLIFKYGFKMKIVVPVVLGYILISVLLPAIGLETTGIERIQGTLTGNEGLNRDYEREAAMVMIEEKPWTGWGFGAKNVGRAASISEMGSHNGYLETIKYMGYPMGGLWLTIAVLATISVSFTLLRKKIRHNFHLANAVATLALAMFEGYFVGVHEFATNYFFVSLAIISVEAYWNKTIVKQNGIHY